MFPKKTPILDKKPDRKKHHKSSWVGHVVGHEGTTTTQHHKGKVYVGRAARAAKHPPMLLEGLEINIDLKKNG